MLICYFNSGYIISFLWHKVKNPALCAIYTFAKQTKKCIWVLIIKWIWPITWLLSDIFPVSRASWIVGLGPQISFQWITNKKKLNRRQEWVFLIYIILLTGQQDFCSCHIKYIIYSWISMKNWTYVGDQNTDDDVVRSNSERGPKETDTSAKYTWLTGETPFHRPSSFSVRITLKKTVIIPTLGALRDKDKNRNGHGHRETKKGENRQNEPKISAFR